MGYLTSVKMGLSGFVRSVSMTAWVLYLMMQREWIMTRARRIPSSSSLRYPDLRRWCSMTTAETVMIRMTWSGVERGWDTREKKLS